MYDGCNNPLSKDSSPNANKTFVIIRNALHSLVCLLLCSEEKERPRLPNGRPRSEALQDRAHRFPRSK